MFCREEAVASFEMKNRLLRFAGNAEQEHSAKGEAEFKARGLLSLKIIVKRPVGALKYIFVFLLYAEETNSKSGYT